MCHLKLKKKTYTVGKSSEPIKLNNEKKIKKMKFSILDILIIKLLCMKTKVPVQFDNN